MDIKHFPEAFYAAAFWLHHNQPKTLLCNITSFGGSINCLIACLSDLFEILHNHPKTLWRTGSTDPQYKLLLDRVMDLLAEQLKSDIDKLKQHRLRMELESENDDKGDEDHAAHAILLFESLGRRLFPPESDEPEEWDQLRQEFLEPLTEYRRMDSIQEPYVVKNYLEEVKADGSIIKPDALLPNHIIRYVKDEDVREAAEILWKAMMENMYLKQKRGKEKKFKKCLVCNITIYMGEPSTELAASLGILVSELSEEPAWPLQALA
ncbi:hypothetical protein CerSpe_015950 [Prunus speciosa]